MLLGVAWLLCGLPHRDLIFSLLPLRGLKHVFLPLCVWRSSEPWSSITQQEAAGVGCSLGSLVFWSQPDKSRPQSALKAVYLICFRSPMTGLWGLTGEGLSLLCQLQTWAPYITRPTVQHGSAAGQNPWPGVSLTGCLLALDQWHCTGQQVSEWVWVSAAELPGLPDPVPPEGKCPTLPWLCSRRLCGGQSLSSMFPSCFSTSLGSLG